MSKRHAIAFALVVLALVAGAATQQKTIWPPSARPAIPALPETLVHRAAAESASAAPVSPWPGVAVVAGIVVLLGTWRARIGARALLAAGAALVVVLHPATLAAIAEPGLDLAALAIVLLGAAIRARPGPWSGPVGMVVLLIGVLTARSAGPVAALAAFALLEPDPPHWSGAALLLLYGAARHFGLPGLPELLAPTPVPAVPADAVAPLLDRLIGSASAVLPIRPVIVAHAEPVLACAVALAALLVLGVTVIGAERRFGGPFAALFALLGIALLAIDAPQGGAPVAAAALPIVVLVGVYLAGAAEPLAGARAAVASLLLLAFLVTESIVTVAALPRFREPFGALRAAARSDVDSAARRPLARAALHARLAADGEAARALAASIAATTEVPDSAARAEVWRDVAISAALAGAPDAAIPVMQRVVASGHDREARELELLDLLLRAGRPEAAGSLAADLLRDAREARRRAELLSRQASARVVEAFLGPADPVGRERALAGARALLDEAAQADPTCVRALLDRGRFRIVAGDAVGAVTDLEEAARRGSDLAEPHLELARLMFSRAQDGAGAREFAEAERIAGKDDAEVRLVRVQLDLARGDLAAAKSEADRLLADVNRLRGGKRELADQFRRIAVAAEDGRDAKLAGAACRAALSLGRDDTGQATALMLRLLRQARDFGGMLDLLDRAEQDRIPVENARTERVQALKNAGLALLATLQADQRPAARERFLAALEATEDFADLGSLPSLVRQLCEEPGGDVQRLVAPARRAFDLGVAAMRERRADAALALFDVSLALVPGNPYVLVDRGVVLGALGRADDARASFEAAVRAAESLGDTEAANAARRALKG